MPSDPQIKRLLNDSGTKKVDEQLAVAYAANGRMNLELLEEFKSADCEW